MIVELTASVFHPDLPPRDARLLITLLTLAEDGDHAVIHEEDEPSEAFLRRFGSAIDRNWLHDLLDRGVESRDRFRRHIRVYTGAVPKGGFGLAEAIQIVRAPLTVVVESAINDAAFLSWWASWTADGPSWSEALANDRLALHHGGGNSEMKRQLRAWRERKPARLESTGLVTDSDAPERGKFPEPTQALERECKECWPKGKGQNWFILKRRTIENYLPPSALAASCDPGHQDTVRAYEALPDELRHFWHVKEGMLKNVPSAGQKRDEVRERLDKGSHTAEDEAALHPGAWASVRPAHHLYRGLGPRIAERTLERLESESHPLDPGARAEGAGVIGALLRCR